MFKGLSIADQCLVYRCLYYCYGLTPIPDYEYDMLEKEAIKIAPIDHSIHLPGSDRLVSYSEKIQQIAKSFL